MCSNKHSNKHKSTFKQVGELCLQRQKQLIKNIAFISRDWKFNTKKSTKEQYEKRVFKIIWNVTAKKIQKYGFLQNQ